MKQCTRCKLVKPIDDFAWRYQKRGIKQSSCRECHKWYDKTNSTKINYKQRKKNNHDKIHDRNSEFIFSYLQLHPCIDCGEKDPIVLEFDHQYDKKYQIADLFSRASLTRLKVEVEKCVVRCANCHRRKTAKELGWYKTALQRTVSIDISD